MCSVNVVNIICCFCFILEGIRGGFGHLATPGYAHAPVLIKINYVIFAADFASAFAGLLALSETEARI